MNNPRHSSLNVGRILSGLLLFLQMPGPDCSGQTVDRSIQTGKVVLLDGTQSRLPATIQVPRSGYLVGSVQVFRDETDARKFRSKWNRTHRAAIETSRNDMKLKATDREEWNARNAFLETVVFRDPGKVLDRVVYKTANQWYELIDTDEDDNLNDERPHVVTGKRVDLVERPIQPLPGLSLPRLPANSTFEDKLTRLKLLDGIQRKNHLPGIVELCTDLIGEARNLDSPKEADSRTDQNNLIADLLYRRGRALAYMELPDVLKRHPIADRKRHDRAFEANFKKLAERVDTTGPSYFLLHVRRERRMGRYGVALRVLTHHMKRTPDSYFLHKKRRDLCRLLGWDHLAQQYDGWLRLEYVSRYQP